MAFGLSFGTSKTKSNSTTTLDRNELTNQTGSEATDSTRTSQQSQTGTQAGSSTGASNTNQVSQQTGQTTGQTTTTGRQSSFSEGLTGEMEAAISALLGGAGVAGKALSQGVKQLSSFDPVDFVRGVMDNATSRANSSLDESVNGIMDRIGSSVNNNSMAALLQQRAVNDSSANLAGIQSAAVAQANQIGANNLGAIGQANDSGTRLAQALASGNQTTTQTTAMSELQQMLNQAIGSTDTSEQNQQANQTTATTTEMLSQLINNLLSGNTQTTGTEKVVGKTKQSGAGLSF